MKKHSASALLIIAMLLLVAAPVVAQDEPIATLCVVHNNADHPSITATANGFSDEAEIFNMEVVFFDPASIRLQASQ
jgi:ABC-type sugar transport system substrate-binding protein